MKGRSAKDGMAIDVKMPDGWWWSMYVFGGEDACNDVAERLAASGWTKMGRGDARGGKKMRVTKETDEGTKLVRLWLRTIQKTGGGLLPCRAAAEKAVATLREEGVPQAAEKAGRG